MGSDPITDPRLIAITDFSFIIPYKRMHFNHSLINILHPSL